LFVAEKRFLCPFTGLESLIFATRLLGSSKLEVPFRGGARQSLDAREPEEAKVLSLSARRARSLDVDFVFLVSSSHVSPSPSVEKELL
jgi:hypothetical protein